MNEQFYTEIEKLEKEMNKFVNVHVKNFMIHLKAEANLKEVNLNEDVLNFDLKEDAPGIYYFEAKFQPMKVNISFEECHEMISSNWNELGKDYNYPKIYKSNPLSHFERIRKGEWVPFYIGVRKMVKLRLKEHIYKPSSDKTYAMRLAERKLNMKFRVSYVLLDKIVEDQYFLVEQFEKELRRLIKPIVGKQ